MSTSSIFTPKHPKTPKKDVFPVPKPFKLTDQSNIKPNRKLPTLMHDITVGACFATITRKQKTLNTVTTEKKEIIKK